MLLVDWTQNSKGHWEQRTMLRPHQGRMAAKRTGSIRSWGISTPGCLHPTRSRPSHRPGKPRTHRARGGHRNPGWSPGSSGENHLKWGATQRQQRHHPAASDQPDRHPGRLQQRSASAAWRGRTGQTVAKQAPLPTRQHVCVRTRSLF